MRFLIYIIDNNMKIKEPKIAVLTGPQISVVLATPEGSRMGWILVIFCGRILGVAQITR